MLLKNYDKDQCELKFKNSFFDCNVCFNETVGKNCFKFNKCEHVFCNECMRTYFETQIADGNAKGLVCPHDKCEEKATPAQVLNNYYRWKFKFINFNVYLPKKVLNLVGEELFQRYNSQLMQEAYNIMGDIVYCPRAGCQSAIWTVIYINIMYILIALMNLIEWLYIWFNELIVNCLYFKSFILTFWRVFLIFKNNSLIRAIPYSLRPKSSSMCYSLLWPSQDSFFYAFVSRYEYKNFSRIIHFLENSSLNLNFKSILSIEIDYIFQKQ